MDLQDCKSKLMRTKVHWDRRRTMLT